MLCAEHMPSLLKGRGAATPGTRQAVESDSDDEVDEAKASLRAVVGSMMAKLSPEDQERCSLRHTYSSAAPQRF